MKEKRTFEVRSLNEDYDHEKYCGVVEGYAVVFETPEVPPPITTKSYFIIYPFFKF